MSSEPPDDLARRALEVFLRTAEHLECPVEDLVARLEEGRLWFVVHLMERAREELEEAVATDDPEGVARGPAERALGHVTAGIRVVRER